MELKTTRWAVTEGIATLTLARPESHNAWTGRMHTELRHLLTEAESDRAVRVVIITGDEAGGAFCPGADFKALEGHAERGGYDAGTPDDLAMPGYGRRDEFDADFAYFLGLDTVTIAAINGAAAGVGLALACWCDLRFAAAGARMTTAHGRLNLPAEYGLAWLLPRLIGQTRAADLLLSSRVFEADEAERIGLVNRCVQPELVVETATEYARELIERVSPHSLRATKQQLSMGAVVNDPAAAVRDGQRRLELMMTEENYREAAAAVIANKTPKWRDR